MRIYSQNIWGNFSSKECIGNRNFLIHQLIEKYQPDFCCFQECNPSTSRKDNSISILLKDNYDEVLLENENKNFTPIFYNRNKVKFVCGEYVVYSGLNDWDSKSFTWGLFENLENKERVVVISTHLWWKYTGEVDILQRRENVKQLLRKLEVNFFDCSISTGLYVIKSRKFLWILNFHYLCYLNLYYSFLQ